MRKSACCARAALACAFAWVLIGAWSGIAAAQPYPSKTIRLINPLGSGGTAEMLARTAAKALSDQLGQVVVVESKAGAAGTIGADYVAKSAPDGYTLLYGVIGTMSITPALYSKLPYDPEKDLAPVTILFNGPNVLIVNASLNVNSVQELIALAKSKPGALTFASAGNGSVAHLSGELFKQAAGIDMLHVPYKGGGAAVPDLLSGRVSMMIEPGPNAMALVRSGKVRALAVTTPQRAATAPDVPTMVESGLPGVVVTTWSGLFAPGGTPRAIVDRLSEEYARAARNPVYRDQIAAISFEVMNSTPDQFRSFVREEIAKWSAVVRQAGIRIE